MKYVKKHQWPTEGATIKFVNRKTDRLDARVDRLHLALSRMSTRLAVLEQPQVDLETIEEE